MTRFRGVALLLIIAATGFAVLFAIAKTTDAGLFAPLTRLDLYVAQYLFASRNPQVVNFFTDVTAFGSWTILFLLAGSASALMWLHRKVAYVAGLWVTLIGNQTTVSILKVIFARPRPDFGVYRELTASFPSGHSAASVAVYGFLTCMLIRTGFGPRLGIAAGGVLAVVMVGSSRLVLGEHYLSDVLGGYVVGAVWVGLGLWLSAQPGALGATANPVVTRRFVTWAVVLCTGVALWLAVATYTGRLGDPATSWPGTISGP